MFKLWFLIGYLFVLSFEGVIANPVLEGSGIYGEKFQGDIKLTENQEKILQDVDQVEGHNPRTGTVHLFYRWPKNMQGFVVVPYRINLSDDFTQSEINTIVGEFRLLENRTCIRFVERTYQKDFIEIIDGDGCWSWLGKIGGRQELSLCRSCGCLEEGITSHEVIHALGYGHMHNHIDRDDYVKIVWNNIRPVFHKAFSKVNPKLFDNFGTSYDLLSIMHYARRSFSMNGQDTIIPHDRRYIDIIGLKILSEGDATRLSRMYQCPL